MLVIKLLNIKKYGRVKTNVLLNSALGLGGHYHALIALLPVAIGSRLSGSQNPSRRCDEKNSS